MNERSKNKRVQNWGILWLICARSVRIIIWLLIAQFWIRSFELFFRMRIYIFFQYNFSVSFAVIFAIPLSWIGWADQKKSAVAGISTSSSLWQEYHGLLVTYKLRITVDARRLASRQGWASRCNGVTPWVTVTVTPGRVTGHVTHIVTRYHIKVVTSRNVSRHVTH